MRKRKIVQRGSDDWPPMGSRTSTDFSLLFRFSERDLLTITVHVRRAAHRVWNFGWANKLDPTVTVQ